MPQACQMLRSSRRMYSVYMNYSPDDREKLLSGAWLDEILPLHPLFAFLNAGYSCPAELKDEVYRYVLSVRNSQSYPVLLMDITNDELAIDQIISDDVCMAGFDACGSLCTIGSVIPEQNIFKKPLKAILKDTMKKQ